jgi:hypothetical protein
MIHLSTGMCRPKNSFKKNEWARIHFLSGDLWHKENNFDQIVLEGQKSHYTSHKHTIQIYYLLQMWFEFHLLIQHKKWFLRFTLFSRHSWRQLWKVLGLHVWFYIAKLCNINDIKLCTQHHIWVSVDAFHQRYTNMKFFNQNTALSQKINTFLDKKWKWSLCHLHQWCTLRPGGQTTCELFFTKPYGYQCTVHL